MKLTRRNSISGTEESFYSADEEEEYARARLEGGLPGRSPRKPQDQGRASSKESLQAREAGWTRRPTGSKRPSAKPYRRKSQLGKQLEASVSSLSPILPMPAQQTLRRVSVSVIESGESSKTQERQVNSNSQYGSPQEVRSAATTPVHANNSATTTANGMEMEIAKAALASPAVSAVQATDAYLLQTTLKKIKEIGLGLETIQHRVSGDKIAASISGKSSNGMDLGHHMGNGSASGEQVTQYEVLESLSTVQRSVNQLGQMLDVKDEIYSLVQENFKLKMKSVRREKQREIERLQKDLTSSNRKKWKDEESWDRGEKQRVLEEFHYLKSLYDKDRRRMEGLLADAERRLESLHVTTSAHAFSDVPQAVYNNGGAYFTPASQAEASLVGIPSSSFQKRNSLVDISRSTSPYQKRKSMSSVSPLIHTFQDRIQDKLSGPHDSVVGLDASQDYHLVHSPNETSSSHDMMELVDMLTEENSKLRQQIATNTNSSG